MRSLVFPIFMCLLILTGCGHEKDFDKKYEAADAQLKAEMERLDKQIDTELKREPGDVEETREPK
jgi:hypothetical protein